MNAAVPDLQPQQALRRLGGLAHQLRAAVRASDRFLTLGPAEDRDTACWLMSTAVALGAEVAEELDGLARTAREAGADSAASQRMAQWRMNAHQLHAACRAADLYLEQDSRDEQDTGTWLVACALGLADKLAGALDDGVGARMADKPRGSGDGAKRLSPAARQSA